MGQDGGLAIPWRGKIYWFWGDTAKPSYPLGNFGTSGATSELPSQGGLNPNIGVDLNYFVDASGFTRPMLPSENFPGPGARWIGGLKIVADGAGNERLVTDYMRIKDLGETYERGIAIFNDKAETFERLVQFDPHDSLIPACTTGQPTRTRVMGTDFYYQVYTPPLLCRVRADLDHVKNSSAYEGFSPLVAGTRYLKAESRLDRDASGHLRFAWKPNTPPLRPTEEKELIADGKMTASEGFFQLRNVDTDKAVQPGPGSVEWSAFRRRWVMIVKEDEGVSNHGTLWFAEADTQLGPWVYAKRILRHDYYNFYNPLQHKFFDEDNGRVIFFEGTYSDFFDAGGPLTPRYNYNEIMYRLDLSDPRLALPVPVYLMRGDHSTERYLLGNGVNAQDGWERVKTVPFFAIPPDYSHEGLIPIFAYTGKRGTELRSQPPYQADAVPLFYALPLVPPAASNPQGLSGEWSCNGRMRNESDSTPLALDLRVEGEVVRSAAGAEEVQGTFRNGNVQLALHTEDGIYLLSGELKEEKLTGTWKNQVEATQHGTWHCERPPAKPRTVSPAIVPLYEYVDVNDGSYLYSTNASLQDKGLRRAAEPLCRVWRNPLSQLFLDPAKPVARP